MSNPLVDQDSQFDVNEHAVTPDSLSPFTEGSSWTAGSGIIASADGLVQSVQDDDLVGMITGAAAVGMGAVGAVLDPIGTAASMLVGWMIEHIKPLNMILDSLAGSPEMIQGRANTWQNISGHLEGAAEKYAGSINSGTSDWQGKASDAYRKMGADTAEVIGSAGKLSQGMSALVTMVGEMCAAARIVIHMVISELVGKLVAWAAELLGTLGLATPVVVAQAMAAIGKVSTRVVKTTVEITEAISKALKYANQIRVAIQQILEILKEIPNLVGAMKA